MVKKELLLQPVVIAFLIFLPGCSHKETANNTETYMNILTENEWSGLSKARIFFGHQSVGFNIVDGINDLKNATHFNSFKIIETRKATGLSQPAFAHSTIGKNQDPVSKIDDFVNILENGMADSVDIALLKFCYIDFNNHTQVKELFAYYQTAINSLHKKFPALKVIHCTVPLTVKPTGLKGFAKILLGRDDNVYRNRFNKLIRKHYKDTEIADIANIESSWSDGTRNKSFTGIPGLIPAYASDGRHLNQTGGALVAAGFLKTLSEKIRN